MPSKQPPPMPNVGKITRGIGKLTPNVWDSFVWAAEWLHENVSGLNALLNESKRKKIVRPFFLAQIKEAKLVSENQYIYSWDKVTIATSGEHAFGVDETLNSTVDSDDYGNYAINLVETDNSATLTAPGINEGAGGFPSGFSMQAFGGGSTDVINATVALAVNPIVLMFVFRDDNAAARYLFSASNSYDGSCS